MAEPGGTDTLEPAKPTLKRPGGVAYPRPPVINGKTYDPFHAPKSVQNPDGTQGFIGGKEIDTDTAYANRYWAREKFPDEMREVFQRAIERDAPTGQTGLFVDKAGITETDKERLSALRKTAEELGYEVGNFVFRLGPPWLLSRKSQSNFPFLCGYFHLI